MELAEAEPANEPELQIQLAPLTTYFGPGLGPGSESNLITLHLIPLHAQSSESPFLERVSLTLSHLITLRLNRRFNDFGSEGWGFKSLRAHH